MFSKKRVVFAGAVVLIALNLILISFFYIRKTSAVDLATRAALFIVSPVQESVTSIENFADGLWRHYFFLVSTAYKNDDLEKRLAIALEKNNTCRETSLENQRLRAFVGLEEKTPFKLVAAEVVARDPSPWYQTIIVNKGGSDGVGAGCPVIRPEGIVGQVMTASSGYAKVLLIVDRNSAVDSIVQRTRARGVTRGDADSGCIFDYALRKHDIRVGDAIISSGLDGIYPKGLRIGHVTKVIRRNSGLFQDIELIPYVDFARLEQVMIIVNLPKRDFDDN